MKRLLMVSTISRFLRDFLMPFAWHFREKGWQVDALTSNIAAFPECAEPFNHVWEVNWSRSPLDPMNFRGTPEKVRRIVEDEGYDLVHVHTPVAALVTRYALKDLRRQGKTKVIYTAHGFHFHPHGTFPKNQLFYATEKLAGAWTDYLVVMNREDEASARKGRFVADDHLMYMPGIGVDLQRYRQDAISEEAVAEVYHTLGITPGTPYLLMVAEYIPRKRHADALQAFARLENRHVHLVLAGSGFLEERTQDLAVSLGIANRVHFLGFRRDVRAYVRSAYATVLPSSQEGLPRCIMESLAFGVPVIGTDVRGTRDLVQGGAGLLVTLGDIPGLAQAMDWMLAHPVEARQMGETGKRQMAAYELNAIIQHHELLYAQALQEAAVTVPYTLPVSIDTWTPVER